MRNEYFFGDYLLVVTDHGFWLEDIPNKEIVLDASTLNHPSTHWIVEIMNKDVLNREFYTDVNTSSTGRYFYAGIARKNNEE